MRFRHLLIPFLAFFFTEVNAQVLNDDCNTATLIPDVSSWCSQGGHFTNADATPGGFSAAACFTGPGNDVWFTFVARATDITITCKPGTLAKPEMALYGGGCNSSISEIQCKSGFTGGVLELYKGGLVPGSIYLLRVQGEGISTGTFDLCFNNYFPPVKPGSDCVTASILCDKSAFIVQNVSGFGNVPDELKDAPCLAGNNNVSSESNSTWYKWTCDSSGSLTFQLTPLAENDDIDFAVYELNGDLSTCDRTLLRCEAASCKGPTGLSTDASDVNEQPNCDQGQNNWLAPIQMEAGKSYLLGINNFTAAGNGFKISFGGTGTFKGPIPDFEIVQDGNVCREENVQIIDKSRDPSATITDYLWTFGPDASIQSSTQPGDKTVSYLKRGDKIISLTLKNDKGCVVSRSQDLNILCCGPGQVMSLSADSTVLRIGDSINIGASAILEGDQIFYAWAPSALINCQGCDLNNIRFFRNTWVYATATDQFNCQLRDSILIRVDPHYPVYAPNVFTPNHDGVNDNFTIFTNYVAAEILTLKIFDRWGECVFERDNFLPNDDKLGWDGRFKGKFMNPATFAWMAQIKFIDGNTKIFKGSVSIIK